MDEKREFQEILWDSELKVILIKMNSERRMKREKKAYH